VSVPKRLAFAAVLAAALTGCAAPPPQRPHPLSTQEFTVEMKLTAAYDRLRGRLEVCRIVTNILQPAKLVGQIDPGGSHAKISIVEPTRTGQRIPWGAQLQSVGTATRVLTFTDNAVSASRVHQTMRRWLTTASPQTGYPEC